MNNDKQNNQEENETKDLLDVLLDRDNRDTILLQDESGKTIEFEQVCVIPYDVEGQDRTLYAVLKPVDHIDGINEDEAVVFKVVYPTGVTALVLEEDEERAIEVFNKYYDLLEEVAAEEQKKSKKK